MEHIKNFEITCYGKIFTILLRALYLINWIYRYHTENYYDKIVIVAGCVQTVLYLDFFYLYATKGTSYPTPTHLTRMPTHNTRTDLDKPIFFSVIRGKRLTLPTTVDKI